MIFCGPDEMIRAKKIDFDCRKKLIIRKAQGILIPEVK
jgi:hypothetical protein